jgi:hypothetical protein
MDTLEGARENLRCRERCKTLDSIGYLAQDGMSPIIPIQEIARRVQDWLQTRPELGAVIWTGLSCNYHEITEEPFSVENAIAWLRTLVNEGKEDEAEKYIRRAPSQTNTRVRIRCREEFGWNDLAID